MALLLQKQDAPTPKGDIPTLFTSVNPLIKVKGMKVYLTNGTTERYGMLQKISFNACTPCNMRSQL
jgi:hypothetical protein